MWIGPAVIPYRATLFEKSGTTIGSFRGIRIRRFRFRTAMKL